MESRRAAYLTLFTFVLFSTGCENRSDERTLTVDPRVRADQARHWNLDEATLIDADYCAVSGVTAGSSYEDVLSVFGKPKTTTPGVSRRSRIKSIEYDGVSIWLSEDRVLLVSTERAEYGLNGGLQPSSSRDAVLQLLGETVRMSSESYELLAYRCRDLKTPDGNVILGFRLVDGMVDHISLVHPDAPGMGSRRER